MVPEIEIFVWILLILIPIYNVDTFKFEEIMLDNSIKVIPAGYIELH